MPQRLFVSTGPVVLVANANEDHTRPVLTPRVREAPRLLGYRMGGNAPATLTDGGDTNSFGLAVTLRASDRPVPDASDSPRTFQDQPTERHIIDYWHKHLTVNAATLVGFFLSPTAWQTEWIHCDLLLPELHVTFLLTNQTGNTHIFRGWLMVEYDWQKVTVAQLVALKMAWGLDAEGKTLP